METSAREAPRAWSLSAAFPRSAATGAPSGERRISTSFHEIPSESPVPSAFSRASFAANLPARNSAGRVDAA